MSKRPQDQPGFSQHSLSHRVELFRDACGNEIVSGSQPQIEDYLAKAAASERPSLLPELLAIEVNLRRMRGESPTVDEYVDRFPEDYELVQAFFASGSSNPENTAATISIRDGSVGDTAPAGDSSRSQLPETFGRYRIQAKLGEGGMGAVYLAVDPRLDRRVAIKVPFLDDETSKSVLARFHREAKSAAALRHPNICPVHEVAEINGIHYIAMAFIEGKPLSAFIKPGQPLQIKTVVTLVRKLARALDEAHKHGVVHRDLKPSNIMIDNRREPIIMDFGLARRQDSGDDQLTQTGQAMGTPRYMPPEQVAGDLDAMGPGCDIYSLGVILYQLLTGTVPFDGDLMSLLNQIAVAQPQPPSARRADIDDSLDRICLKALAKQPAARYSSMGQFAEVLGAYLKHQEALKLPGGEGAEQAKRWADQMMRVLIEYERHAKAIQVRETINAPETIQTNEVDKTDSHGVPTWVWAVGGALAAVLLVTCFVVLFKVLSPGGSDNDGRSEVTDRNWDVPGQRESGTLTLDGRSTYVVIPKFDHEGGPITYEVIIRAGAPSGSTETIFDSGGMSLKREPLDGGLVASLDQSDPGKPPVVVRSDKPVVENKRVNVTTQWDGDQLLLFFDGKLYGRVVTDSKINPSSKLVIGADKDGDKPFSGTIEEMRISNSARYSEEFEPPERLEPDADTMALYDLRERKGNDLVDLSENGLDGEFKETESLVPTDTKPPANYAQSSGNKQEPVPALPTPNEKGENTEKGGVGKPVNENQPNHTKGFVSLEPLELTSFTGRTKFTKIGNHCVLAEGSAEEDVYTVRLNTDVPGITAVRVEALPIDFLTAKGPGHGDNGSFSIFEVHLAAASSDTPEKSKEVLLSGVESKEASAAIEKLIDGVSHTFWPVRRAGQPTALTMFLKTPVWHGNGTTLYLRLTQREKLGHFRVSVSNDPELAGRRTRIEATLPLFVNLGGRDKTDRAGRKWIASQRYEDGAFGYVGGMPAGDDARAPFTSCVDGIEEFRANVPDGKYNVRLLFSTRFPKDAGKRSFFVSAYGVKKKPIKDLPKYQYRDGSVPFGLENVEAKDGVLAIEFSGDKGSPVLNGIEIYPTK